MRGISRPRFKTKNAAMTGYSVLTHTRHHARRVPGVPGSAKRRFFNRGRDTIVTALVNTTARQHHAAQARGRRARRHMPHGRAQSVRRRVLCLSAVYVIYFLLNFIVLRFFFTASKIQYWYTGILVFLASLLAAHSMRIDNPLEASAVMVVRPARIDRFGRLLGSFPPGMAHRLLFQKT